MGSTVYYSSMKSRLTESPLNKIKKLAAKCGAREIYGKNELVAVKVHFGELGNTAFIRPVYLRPVVELLKKCGAKPFLTDTNTLYTGMRTNSVDHVHNANMNGFGYSTLQVPVIIGDGLRGENSVAVPVKKGVLCRQAHLASDIVNADGLFVVSHFKGHEMTGFGGALKNLAMGCASRKGKMDMHSDLRPKADPHKCTACGRCKIDCQSGAIEISGSAYITEKCAGCARCIAVCPEGAISADLDVACDELQRRVAEYASAVHDSFEKTPVYINALVSVVPGCDCRCGNDAPLLPDLGFMASCDPVALDKASYDLVVRTAGKDVFKERWNYLDPEDIFRHAEKIGFGSVEYSLETL